MLTYADVYTHTVRRLCQHRASDRRPIHLVGRAKVAQGTHFTCFSSAKVQMLTHRGAAAQWLAGGGRVAHTLFTSFTSTKEQILTHEELLRSGWEEEGESHILFFLLALLVQTNKY